MYTFYLSTCKDGNCYSFSAITTESGERVHIDNIFDCADSYIIYAKDLSIQKGFYVYNNTYYQKKASGRQPYTDFSRHYDSPVNNQEEFEKAVAVFDEKPKCVKWLDNIPQK